MDATNGTVVDAYGDQVDTASKRFREKPENVENVKIVTSRDRRAKVDDNFLGMIKNNLKSLRKVALLNPIASVINTHGAHLAEFYRDGAVMLFPGIYALTYLSLTMMQRILPNLVIKIQHICAAIEANAHLESFHLKYTNHAVSDATNVALFKSLPILSLKTVTFIDASNKIQKQIYGFDRETKLVETTDVSMIDAQEIIVEHLRVISLEKDADVKGLTDILNRADVDKLKSLYISGTETAIMQLPLKCVSSIPDVTIQILEIESDYREERDVLVKRGNAYDFRVHTDAFCALPSSVLAHMESVCLHFPDANNSLFEAYASLLLPLTELKELDVRRDNGFMLVFIQKISQRNNVEVLAALHTVIVGLSAVPALSNRVFELYGLKALNRIYVRYDAVTKDAMAHLESFEQNMKQNYVDVEYESVLDRMLFQKNE